MALSKDVYRELEDILGTEHISEDLAIMDTYAYTGQHTAALEGADVKYRYHTRPEAVVLPGSTRPVSLNQNWTVPEASSNSSLCNIST